MWQDKAMELWRQGQSWAQIDKAIPQANKEQIRAFIRRTPEYKEKQKKPVDIPAELLKAGRKKTPVTDICERLTLSNRVLKAHVSDLQEQSYEIEIVNGILILQTKVIPKETEHSHIIKGHQFTFGVVSDPHLCNKCQQLTHLNTFYDICAKRGIADVYNVGDLTDGYYKIRPAHIYELHQIGAEQQVNYVADVYPYREGITTHFITGNHDNTHMMNGGINIGAMIDRRRADMNFLGMDYAKIWLTDKCDMDLIHPGDGSAYALSYKMQKRIDALHGGNKPHIMFTGHYHKAFYMLYRNIHAFCVPSFEAQTPFMRSKGLYADVGGWIVTLTVDKDGTIKSITPELIPFYKMIENDY